MSSTAKLNTKVNKQIQTVSTTEGILGMEGGKTDIVRVVSNLGVPIEEAGLPSTRVCTSSNGPDMPAKKYWMILAKAKDS